MVGCTRGVSTSPAHTLGEPKQFASYRSLANSFLTSSVPKNLAVPFRPKSSEWYRGLEGKKEALAGCGAVRELKGTCMR